MYYAITANQTSECDSLQFYHHGYASNCEQCQIHTYSMHYRFMIYHARSSRKNDPQRFVVKATVMCESSNTAFCISIMTHDMHLPKNKTNFNESRLKSLEMQSEMSKYWAQRSDLFQKLCWKATGVGGSFLLRQLVCDNYEHLQFSIEWNITNTNTGICWCQNCNSGLDIADQLSHHFNPCSYCWCHLQATIHITCRFLFKYQPNYHAYYSLMQSPSKAQKVSVK